MDKTLKPKEPITPVNRQTPYNRHHTSLQSPSPFRDDGMPQPKSEYLREMLAEKKAKRMRECSAIVGGPHNISAGRYEPSLCSSISLSSSSGSNAQDDWIFDSDRDSSDFKDYSSRRRRSGAVTRTQQGPSRSRRQNSRRNTKSPNNKRMGDVGTVSASKADARLAFGTKTTERTMGHRETRSVVDRLEKENFDLKLRITLQEERMARITVELDDALALSGQADELRLERDRLQIETTESLEMNEQLVRELERRDYAVEEAAGIIQEMEERMEDVRRALAEGEKEWRRQWQRQEGGESEEDGLVGNRTVHGGGVGKSGIVTSAVRDFSAPTRFDGDNSRPSTAVHDSDYFSAESSPTRSLPLQQQQKVEIPPLSSYIRLLGRPSTLSLISQFSMTEPGIGSVHCDGAESTDERQSAAGNKGFEGEDHSAYAPKITGVSVLRTAKGKHVAPHAFYSYGNKARNQCNAPNDVRNGSSTPQISPYPLHSSPSSSSTHDDEIEEDAEKTVTPYRGIIPQAKSAASSTLSVKLDQQQPQMQQKQRQLKLNRSHSVRVAGSRTDMRGDYWKAEGTQKMEQREGSREQQSFHLQQNQSSQCKRPKERDQAEKFKFYHQRRLYHNVNQVANAMVVSTPDAQVVRADASTITNQSEPVKLIPMHLMERHQYPQGQYEFHSQLQKALRRRNVPLQSFDFFSGRPGLDLKRDREGNKSNDGGNGNENVSQKDIKRVTEKGSSKKEKGKERAHLTDAGDERRGTGSPYSTFLAATASLKAFTNITSAASARLARAGSIGPRPGLKLGPKRPTADDIPGAHPLVTLTPRASTKEDVGGNSGNGSVITNEHTPRGLTQKPVRNARPRANTTENVISSSTPKNGIERNSAATATFKAPALTRNITISTPNTNKQRYLILQGHHHQPQQRHLLRPRQRGLESRSTNTQDNIANDSRDINTTNNDKLEQSPTPHDNSNDVTDNKHTQPRLGNHVHKRPLPPPPPPPQQQQQQHNQKLSHSVFPSSPPSPTPTTVSDPTESMCSFNVEAWGGPPTYKALPREGIWPGMSTRAFDMGNGGTESRLRPGLSSSSTTTRTGPLPRNLFFDGSEM